MTITETSQHEAFEISADIEPPSQHLAGSQRGGTHANRSTLIDASSGPVAVGILDLDSGELALRTSAEEAKTMDRAFVLLRSGGWPVGVELMPLRDGLLDDGFASQLSREIPVNSARAARSDAPFSIVVCTRNRPEKLARSLPNLVALLDDQRELIVVDNAPHDNQAAEVVARFGDRVRYVVEPTPGLARARNCGLMAAEGKFVVFTDDDIDPDPAWIDVLAATFAANAGAVCVSGSVLPSSLATEAQLRFQEFGGYQRSFVETELHLSLDPAPSKLFPFHPRLVGTGANMAFRTEALVSVGGFDEALGAGTPARGGEDIDIGVRMLLAGHLVVRQPAAVVWHESHRTNADLASQIEDYGCGLAAAFTKFAGKRSIAPMMLRKVPAGLGVLLRSDSVKNDARSSAYPVELRAAEWKGLRAGPLGYRRSLRQARRLLREA